MLLFFYLFFYSGNNENVHVLSQTPIKENAYTLTLKHHLVSNDEFNFYGGIVSTLSPDGKIIVFDLGNCKLRLFDSFGKHTLSFGERGYGPGEFTDMFIKILATNDRVYLKNDQRLQVFDYKGTLLSEERSLISSSTEFYKSESGIVFEDHKNSKQTIIKEIFDLNGKLKNTVKSLNGLTKGQCIEMLKKGDFKSTYSPERLIITTNRRFEYAGGTYEFHVIDDEYNNVGSYKRSFLRVKREPPKNNSPRLQAVFKQMGEYYPDIRRILGVIDHYILVQVSSAEKNRAYIDVINTKTHQFYTQIKIEGDRIDGPIQYVNGKLIVHKKNDEDGLYLDAYGIEIQ